MTKLPLFLAFALVLSSAAFAKKGDSKPVPVPLDKSVKFKPVPSSSKDCYLVCRDGSIIALHSNGDYCLVDSDRGFRLSERDKKVIKSCGK